MKLTEKKENFNCAMAVILKQSPMLPINILDQLCHPTLSRPANLSFSKGVFYYKLKIAQVSPNYKANDA